MFGLLAALAVALVEYRGVAKAPLPAIIVLFKHMWSKAWKPLLAGVCTAALAAGSAAEFTTKNFGTTAQSHPVLTYALTGAALLGVTVLVIEVLACV